MHIFRRKITNSPLFYLTIYNFIAPFNKEAIVFLSLEKKKRRKWLFLFYFWYSLMDVAGIVSVSVTPSIERIFSPTK